MFVPRYSETELRAAVASSRTLTEVLQKFDLRSAGGNQAQLKKYLERWQISTEHFDPNAVRTAKLRHSPVRLAEVLVEHSSFSRSSLKHRLYAEGLKRPECEICGQSEMWLGHRISLILDHVNGVPDDNRLENLRIACPNCNAAFETHCARNYAARVERDCVRCGETFRPRARKQKYCSQFCSSRYARVPRPETRKVDRPPEDVLRAEVRATNYRAVGRKYGVSDNAIRKWLRAYRREREQPTESAEGPPERIGGVTA
jgi:5-methylcytosine-specific restriction endonuclease McrA